MKRLFGVIIFIVFNSNLPAQPLSPDKVPQPLKPWVEWVLHGETQRNCPFIYFNDKQRQCAWPSSLKLKLSSKNGSFTQQWRVYQQAWIILPGDQKHWPLSVKLNNDPAIVVSHQNQPAIYLKAGRYTISGQFKWDRLPEALQIPYNTGLVALTVNNKKIDFPDLAENGRLWLRERDSGEKSQGQSDKLELQVFRHIVDDIPLRMITRVQLDVSGRQREVLLGKALFEDYIPLRLHSRLPARLETDGRLRVQVRPGRWTIELEARPPGNTTAFRLADSPPPWPEQEVWVFNAQNQLRLVEVEGSTIDPRQTSLPKEWQSLPAYLMKVNDVLSLKVIRRGDPEPEPDKLTLHRSMWLDFNGEGYTFEDKIKGSMTRGWRLETSRNIELGRVAIDGQAQFITHLPDSKNKGVEVRRGTINLIAESRYQESIRRIPAAGWEHDFHRVSAELNLPPGWTLFSASGVDNVPQTWVQGWTLLDLFLVMILSLAVVRLWNWRWGVLALLTYALIWHQSWAPQIVWVHVLIAIALLRVVPEGKFRRVVIWYRNLSLLGLVLIVIPFSVQQVRNGLYPQLERPWQSVTAAVLARRMVQQEQVIGRLAEPAAPKEEMLRQEPEKRSAKPKKFIASPLSSYESYDQALNLAQIDPKANVQTGPGLPKWKWLTVTLNWNGPVERHQQIGLILVPPVVNMLLNFLRVVLLIIFIAMMMGLRYKKDQGFKFNNPFTSNAIVMLLLGGGMMLSLPQDGLAKEVVQTPATPSADILKQLKARLLASPACLPGCAQSHRMQLDITPTLLKLRLEIHAQQNVAVPLPSHGRHWLPTRVMVNGVAASSLYRDPHQGLWLGLKKGRHLIDLAGPLPPRAELSLPLWLKPHYVSVKAKGWTVEGVHEDGQADDQLQLTRVRGRDNQQQLAALETGALPPFVRVERTLRLGLNWHVETRVVRASPLGSPVVLEIPLLRGEAPITPDIRTNQHRVLVNMSPDQSVFSWRSVLDKQISIRLTAPDTTDWVEVWRADVSPIWHMQADGIAVVHHQDKQHNWLPEWRPWPGEKVSLAISRPVGIDGKTLTIDNSQLQIQPGSRATDSTLTLSLRSSQGGQHSIQLPQAARLQKVEINGVTQPIRQEGNRVTVPLIPGRQSISLSWRSSEGIRPSYRSEQVDIGVASSNTTTNIKLGRDRWILLVRGPQMGPAVLYWGELIVIALIAFALGRVNLTPLKSWQWLLFGIGLSQVSLYMAVFIVAWLMLLGARARLKKLPPDIWFNVMQGALGFLTFLALAFLFIAIQQGLLGTPEMHVAGNMSSAYNLNWYQDRAETSLSDVWVLSVPLLVYRILMLAWALWLAFSLLKWLRWGWQCFTKNGLWISADENKIEAKALPGEDSKQTQAEE